MSYPSLADMVICQHFWWDERTRQGVNASVSFTPKTIGSTTAITPNLTDGAEKAWIKTRAWKVTPDGITGYLAVPLTPNDDPDLTAFGGYEVAPDGETARTVAIPSSAGTTTVTTQMAAALAKLSPPITVTVGATVKTVWLTDVATISNPPSPPNSFFDSTQTTAAIAAGILAHDDDTSAHPDIRALIGLTPTSLFTTGTHTPGSGEEARYNPPANISVALPAAVAGLRFGVTNVSGGTSMVTFTCAGSDVIDNGPATLTLRPGERAVLIGASGGFSIESRTLLATRGTATLTGGTVTVANTNITTGSLIRLTTLAPGGTVGSPYVSARTAATGFTITSTSGSDTSTVFWEIVQY